MLIQFTSILVCVPILVVYANQTHSCIHTNLITITHATNYAFILYVRTRTHTTKPHS